jgi:hypothetical protein
MRGPGSGIVSYLVILEGGRDLSWAATGGYVACQSASVNGTRPGDGGRTVAEKGNGEAGLVLPLDDGLEDGRDVEGDSRNRDGSFGDGARCTGELGREGVRELLWW